MIIIYKLDINNYYIINAVTIKIKTVSKIV